MKALTNLLVCLTIFASTVAVGGEDAHAHRPKKRIWGRYDDLNPEQKAIVQRGGQVTLTENVPGAPWPKITIYQRLDSNPEEALAMFADYELQPSYIPNMTRAKVVAHLDPVTTRVDFRMDIAGDVDYTTDSRVSTYDNDNAFLMESKLVKAESMKDMWGQVQFEQLGTGTLVIYHTFIFPKSGMAGLFKKKAIEMSQKAVSAMARQVDDERKNNPALLQRQIEALRAALNQVRRWRS